MLNTGQEVSLVNKTHKVLTLLVFSFLRVGGDWQQKSEDELENLRQW